MAAGSPQRGEWMAEGRIAQPPAAADKNPASSGEATRLAALRALSILDTDPEASFDEIVHLTTGFLKAQMGGISFIDDKRQWFKSRVGFDISTVDARLAFCSWTLLQSDILEVPDLGADDRFADSPFVTGEMALRYYAGIPVRAPDGEPVGTLCVFDREARAPMGALERRMMKHFAAALERELELRLVLGEILRSREALEQYSEVLGGQLRMLAHDVRSPSHAAIGFSQLLEMMADEGTIDAGQVREFSGHIRQAARSVVDIAGMALTALGSEIAHPDVRLQEKGPVAFDRVVGNCMTMLRPLMRMRNVTVNASLDSVHVDYDEARLRQIVMNLMDNGLRHAPAGAIIKLSLQRQGQNVRLAITNPGQLPTRMEGRLFSTVPLPAIRNDGSVGFGLGLSIVRMLAQEAGGNVGYSEGDGEVAFWVELPACGESAGEPGPVSGA
jgi:signal transduction histidine kinase